MDDTVLVLNNEQMKGLITMKEAVEVMETVFREFGEGRAQFIPRHRIQLPKSTSQGLYYLFNNMTAGVPALNTLALRIDSATVRLRQEAGMMRKDWPGDGVGLVLLFDIETNYLKAIMHDHYLSPIRVAATSALVTRYLARQDARVMGLFGSGAQARAHAESLSVVRPIELIKVYSPNQFHRQAFAKEMSTKLGIEVRPVSDPHMVVEGSDIVMAATNSIEPVFQGEWLEPGTHVCSICMSYGQVKQRETDEATAYRADIIVLNDKQQIRLDSQVELLSLLDKGLLLWDNLYSVSELVVGRCPCRSREQQITVHYSNVGMGLEFAAVGSIVYSRARERGIGTEIPAELFVTRKEGESWSP